MGQSTDALLFFGFSLGDEDDEETECPWTDEDGEHWGAFDDQLAQKLGVSPEPPFEQGDPAKMEVWHKWCDEKRALVEAYPVRIASHCSGDYPMWVLCVKDGFNEAHRGRPIEFKDGLPKIDEEKATKELRAACELLGIKFRDPAWHLASDWN